MKETLNLRDVVDAAVKDIFRRVAKLEVTPAAADPEDCSHSLVTTTKGDYQMTIVLCAGEHVLKTVTENMKRGTISSEQDVMLYTTEFFNILCGHVVTAMNNRIHASARFGIPRYIPNGCAPLDFRAGKTLELSYQSSSGPITVKTIGEP